MSDHTRKVPSKNFSPVGTSSCCQSPYSPDLNLCDRWVNEYIKKQLRETEFSDHKEVKQTVSRVLQETVEELYRMELDKLLKHRTQVIACGGAYVTPS